MVDVIEVKVVFEIIDKLFKTSKQKTNPKQEMGRLKMEITRRIN